MSRVQFSQRTDSTTGRDQMSTPDSNPRTPRPAKLLAVLIVGLLTTVAAILPASASAASPTWQVSLITLPTNLPPGFTAAPGSSGVYPEVALMANNIGAVSTQGQLEITIQLPDGIAPAGEPSRSPRLAFQNGGNTAGNSNGCSVAEQAATCVHTDPVAPGEWLTMQVPLDTEALPDPTDLEIEASISGGSTPAIQITRPVRVSDSSAAPGFLPDSEGLSASAVDEDGLPVTQAGSHPYQVNANFGVPARPRPGSAPLPSGTLHNVRVDMPAGLAVNPSAAPTCSQAEFYTRVCPDASQVGIASVPTASFAYIPQPAELYNVTPPPGSPAAFGFWAANDIPVMVIGGVRPDDFRVTSLVSDSVAIVAILAGRIQLWGVPSDSSHDLIRGECAVASGGGSGETIFDTCPVPRSSVPMLTMPTSCTDSLSVDSGIDIWEDLGNYFERSTSLTDQNGNPTGTTGCGEVPFEPTIDLTPTTTKASSSAGMDVTLEIPQQGLLDRNQLASAHLKRAIVTLPEGVSLNPSASHGLEGCTTDQIGMIEKSPIPRFNGDDPTCPKGSKVGSAEIHTPLLPEPLQGDLYLADPADNPFDTLLSGYLVAQGYGITLKIPGRFETDPDSGQIQAIFDNNPQQPFSKLDLHFKGGDRGLIITPSSCGIYEIESELSPWSAADPDNPTASEIARSTSTFKVDKGPDGGPCLAGDPNQPADPDDLEDRPFSPTMTAGLQSATADSSSPFNLRIQRPDGHQELAAMDVTMPEGVSAKLAGVSQCPDATLNAISSEIGAGAAENASPSCPANSKVGTATVGAGSGSTPFYVSTGKAYLAGPYKGAPLSLAVVVPALAGPFDLGSTVVRSKLNVDKRTAQVSVESDPLPQILHGIPLKVRDLRVNVNRDGFMQSPTNCDPMQVQAQIQGAPGTSASLANRFQVGDCSSLGFQPDLNLSFGSSKKNTKANAHPEMKATLTTAEGDANISYAEVALPQGVFLDQDRLGRICSRPNYAAERCPEESQVGYAVARSPLLDEPLEGPVYLKASDNVLPDLAADLSGIVDIDLFGKVDQKSNKKGLNQIRNTFELVPDVPVSDFELTLEGGSEGLLVNSRNICKSKMAQRTSIELHGHNADTYKTTPLIDSACKQINKKKASKLKAKAKKLLRKAKKADSAKKAKKLRKQARKLKKQAKKLGR